MNELTIEDFDLILESLRYTRRKFEEYQYPTYELKLQRLDECKAVEQKVLALKRRANETCHQ